MDKLMLMLRLISKHSLKAAYVLSVIALIEVVYIFTLAISDGNIDQKEAIDLKAALMRVVDTLQN